MLIIIIIILNITLLLRLPRLKSLSIIWYKALSKNKDKKSGILLYLVYYLL